MTQHFPSGEAVARAFFNLWNHGDADGIGDLFVEDADFVNVVGFWWTRRSQIRKAHDYGFRKIFQNSVVEITELKVRVLKGRNALKKIGVHPEDLSNTRRPQCKTCLDWSMRRHHLSGQVCALLHKRILELNWVKRQKSYRVIKFSPTGEQAFRRWLA